jgi:hypothetical protein
VGDCGIGLTSGDFRDAVHRDHWTASAGNPLRGITRARQSRPITPEEEDSDPAEQRSQC